MSYIDDLRSRVAKIPLEPSVQKSLDVLLQSAVDIEQWIMHDEPFTHIDTFYDWTQADHNRASGPVTWLFQHDHAALGFWHLAQHQRT